MNCTAPLHGSTWAYQRHGCRCPESVRKMRMVWRNRARKRPRGVRGHGSCEVSVADRVAAVERLSAAGLSAREIAVQLRVAPRTVHRIRVRSRSAA